MKADAQHAHLTPLTLANDLAEALDQGLPVTSGRPLSCNVCFDALATLAHWTTALDHWDARVGPEFVTRFHLMARLFEQTQSHERRLDQARRDSTFHQWGLCQLLLEQSSQARPHAPSYALELGELALAVADALDPADYDPEWVADLYATAAANLSELHVFRGNPEQAGELLRSARTSLEAGTGRPAISRRVRAAESLLSSESGRGNPAREAGVVPKIRADMPEIYLKDGSVHRLVRLYLELSESLPTAD